MACAPTSPRDLHLALEAAGAQQARDGWDEQLHRRQPAQLGAPLHGGVGTGEFISQECGWESWEVSKAPWERSLLLCSAPAACLPSLGRPPGVHWVGDLRALKT